MAAGQETGSLVSREEAEFWKWLARYKDEQLGGSLARHFLRTEHLEDAYRAGLRARPEITEGDSPGAA